MKRVHTTTSHQVPCTSAPAIPTAANPYNKNCLGPADSTRKGGGRKGHESSGGVVWVTKVAKRHTVARHDTGLMKLSEVWINHSVLMLMASKVHQGNTSISSCFTVSHGPRYVMQLRVSSQMGHC
ncbi:MAG: hypothetical protein JKY23_00355 [Nitrospinaceae bacterium]|nr:hypothetical protein [Nitrospinaceae bacterium]